MLRLDEDMHIHSTFSDGRNTVEENMKTAMERGLKRMTCVDHVRRDTDWLPEFVKTVRALNEANEIEMFTGVEAKMLNTKGDLDLPPDYQLADYIYAADHQIPWIDGPLNPSKAKVKLTSGDITPAQFFEYLEISYIGAAERYERVVMAHMFSVLPKIGLCEDDIPQDMLERLVSVFAKRKVPIEVDERWACPGYRVCRMMLDAGVQVWTSSDSHRADTIGEYDFVAKLADQLQQDEPSLAMASGDA